MGIVEEHCSTHAEAMDENRTGGVQMTSRSQNLDSGLHLDSGSDSVSDDGDGDGDDEDEEDALISNGAEQEVMQTEMNMEMEMEVQVQVEMDLNKTQAWALYLSHFLSTWNGRSYEFAAVSYVMR